MCSIPAWCACPRYGNLTGNPFLSLAGLQRMVFSLRYLGNLSQACHAGCRPLGLQVQLQTVRECLQFQASPSQWELWYFCGFSPTRHTCSRLGNWLPEQSTLILDRVFCLAFPGCTQLDESCSLQSGNHEEHHWSNLGSATVIPVFFSSNSKGSQPGSWSVFNGLPLEFYHWVLNWVLNCRPSLVRNLFVFFIKGEMWTYKKTYILTSLQQHGLTVTALCSGHQCSLWCWAEEREGPAGLGSQTCTKSHLASVWIPKLSGSF